MKRLTRFDGRRWRTNPARRCALRLLTVALILGSLNLPPQVRVAAAAPISEEVLEALNVVKTHQANPAAPLPVDPVTYGRMQALLFKNNPAVQRAALNGYITDQEFQAAQRDYAVLNEEFAAQAAADAGARFTKQVSKTPSCYSPGTDSDYITQVTRVEQIDQMQSGYNRYVNQYLDSNGMLRPDEFGTEWHRLLDTDFMADPDLITSEADFKAIQAKNYAAYGRRESAEMERLLREPAGLQTGEAITPPGEITPERVRAYTLEMQEMAEHRNQMLAEIRAKGGYLIENSDARADWFKNMALEEKYISRIEEATDALRTQNGLSPLDRGKGSIALRGSKRALYDPSGNPTNNFERAGSAAAVAENSLNRANFELATSVAEVAKSNPAFRAAAPGDIAAISQQLTPAQKGFLLEQIRQGGNNELAAAVAASMRESWSPETDPAYRGRFQDTARQANSRPRARLRPTLVSPPGTRRSRSRSASNLTPASSPTSTAGSSTSSARSGSRA